ncbi:7979_t:CDS:1, partial [Racocetra fulgida]
DGHNIENKIKHIIIAFAILDQKEPDNYYTIIIYSSIENYKLLKNAI